MSQIIRVLIVDDHTIVRKGIRALLAEIADLEVVGEAADGQEAIVQADRLRPDVILMDLAMPRMDGIEATRQMKATCPEIRVLILPAYDEDPYVFALLRAGADGYVLKNSDPDDLVRAVKQVAAGGTVLAPDIAAKVVAQMTAGKPMGAAEQIEPLSERELAVLRLAAQGLTNKAIAVELGLSDRTIQGHLANIYGKLAVASRTEAVTKALKLGWLVLDDA